MTASTTIPVIISFWGLFGIMLYAAIVSADCPNTREILGYILMSFIVGWTSFLFACAKVEVDIKQFPFGATPLPLLSIWGGFLLSGFTDENMALGCRRNLWYCSAFLFIGQIFVGMGFIYIYCYNRFTCKRTTRLLETIAVAPLFPEVAMTRPVRV